jgi:hypothetical protein
MQAMKDQLSQLGYVLPEKSYAYPADVNVKASAGQFEPRASKGKQPMADLSSSSAAGGYHACHDMY